MNRGFRSACGVLGLLAFAACADEDGFQGGSAVIASVPGSVVGLHAPDTAADVWPFAFPEDVLPTGASTRPIVVFLDAGHGAKDNPGNSSCFCVKEADFTEALAHDVMGYLDELSGFSVVLSRSGNQLVSYADRVEAARRARADVFVSLHSDIRGAPREWSPDGGSSKCLLSHEAPGFSVLFSDEGAAPLPGSRRRLADAIASSLLEARFLPYGGAEYAGLYDFVDGSPEGVFVDRHEPNKRIFVLRRTAMPAVIVETHNALDSREAILWEDPIVRRTFSLALAKGLAVALGAHETL